MMMMKKKKTPPRLKEEKNNHRCSQKCGGNDEQTRSRKSWNHPHFGAAEYAWYCGWMGVSMLSVWVVCLCSTSSSKWGASSREQREGQTLWSISLCIILKIKLMCESVAWLGNEDDVASNMNQGQNVLPLCRIILYRLSICIPLLHTYLCVFHNYVSHPTKYHKLHSFLP